MKILDLKFYEEDLVANGIRLDKLNLARFLIGNGYLKFSIKNKVFITQEGPKLSSC